MCTVRCTSGRHDGDAAPVTAHSLPLEAPHEPGLFKKTPPHEYGSGRGGGTFATADLQSSDSNFSATFKNRPGHNTSAPVRGFSRRCQVNRRDGKRLYCVRSDKQTDNLI